MFSQYGHVYIPDVGRFDPGRCSRAQAADDADDDAPNVKSNKGARRVDSPDARVTMIDLSIHSRAR